MIAPYPGDRKLMAVIMVITGAVLVACSAEPVRIDSVTPTAPAPTRPGASTGVPVMDAFTSTPLPTPSRAESAKSIVIISTSIVPLTTSTEVPTPTATEVPLPGASAEAAAGAVGSADTADTYIDDRSSPERVIASYVNALNRREYARAYSYWANTAPLRSYAQFVRGYANTRTLQFAIGAVISTVYAGQTLYSVPVVLRATDVRGGVTTYVACYRMRQASPGAQRPPFRPLGLWSATLQPVQSDADAQALLGHNCP